MGSSLHLVAESLLGEIKIWLEVAAYLHATPFHGCAHTVQPVEIFWLPSPFLKQRVGLQSEHAGGTNRTRGMRGKCFGQFANAVERNAFNQLRPFSAVSNQLDREFIGVIWPGMGHSRCKRLNLSKIRMHEHDLVEHKSCMGLRAARVPRTLSCGRLVGNAQGDYRGSHSSGCRKDRASRSGPSCPIASLQWPPVQVIDHA